MASPSPERTEKSRSSAGLSAEDTELLERVAGRVVALRMELPALLTLETGRPLSLLASQTLIFFEPFVAAMLRVPDYRRFASLIERRESIEALIRLIEAKADDAARARRLATAERRAAGRSGRGH